MPVNQINLKHARAEYAYRCVTDVLRLGDQVKKYKTLILNTPVRIQSSGLMQTLAFSCSKMEKNPHHQQLVLHMAKWVLRDKAIRGIAIDTRSWEENRDETMGLFELLLSQPDEVMMQFTREALEVTQWLKRFADARIEEPGEDENANRATPPAQSE